MVVHIPTRTTIYIDAAGCEETRTTMRSELVEIRTALSKFEDHSWLDVFTNSLSSLQAIRLHYYKPGLLVAPHYHHHMLLLQIISHLLEARRENGYTAALRNIRAHTRIRDNNLADVLAKQVVADYDTLPREHTMRVIYLCYNSGWRVSPACKWARPRISCPSVLWSRPAVKAPHFTRFCPASSACSWCRLGDIRVRSRFYEQVTLMGLRGV